MVLRGAIASFTRGMTRCTVVILCFVGVQRTGCITLVFVHNKMMLATGAFVRSVLATGAIRLAGYACTVLCIWKYPITIHLDRFFITFCHLIYLLRVTHMVLPFNLLYFLSMHKQRLQSID